MDASLSANEKKKIRDAYWRTKAPWDDPDDSDYDETETNILQRAKFLFREDVELRLVALDDGRWVLGMWVAFEYHKGVDRELLP